MTGLASEDTSSVVMSAPVYVGDALRKSRAGQVDGGYVSLGGERFYRIANYDMMADFFMSIVSHSDHWLFISSNGALTAGRKNPEHALFPYYSVDKIHDSEGVTGGKTMLLASRNGRAHLWEPFARAYDDLYDLERNLYKNSSGNKLLFEELNKDLDLTFQTMWTTSDRFGFVRRSSLTNSGANAVPVRLLDGIQNILPYGIDRQLQTDRSNLLDAYKKNELLADSGLGLFLLSSIPVDRPEPSEALSATTVWSVGLETTKHLLSSQQIDRFRRGEALDSEVDVRAQRGSYFVATDLILTPGSTHAWYIVADLDQGPDEVAVLRKTLTDREALREALEQDIVDGTSRLRKIVAGADGLQLTADELSIGRHFSNVLFNVMRGGTFASGYRIARTDLVDFIEKHNRRVSAAHHEFLNTLDDHTDLDILLDRARSQQDPDLIRLCHEYLPLYFSRRHGDPSRPWNYFSIDVKAENGAPLLSYQGNWRDIFQNWEALLVSYPGFTSNIITKFANASTPDGYNPYRITRNGIDWETEDPADPWSFIGYWGDHQIVYLLKLLEISRRFNPGELQRMLVAKEFAYANVPYRIRPYDRLIEDPHNTIDFDHDLEEVIQGRVREIGADGRLVFETDGAIAKANLLEKILVSVLTKYSNFIPEAGIWMNTQRPEWNDANNALVGYGVSMVTLCYLRRFQQFMRDLVSDTECDTFPISEAVEAFLADVTRVFASERRLLDGPISDGVRRRVLDALGQAGEKYRQRVYSAGFGEGSVAVSKESVLEFIDSSLAWTDHSIRANRRPDGLYHAYNLMTVEGVEVSINRLYEMLEGQVAVLSSGVLSPRESVEVLAALKESKLFTPEQYSYLLYPDRRLARFDEKNRVPADSIAGSRLLSRLVAEGDRRVVTEDANGDFHFNGTFRNSDDLSIALSELADDGFGDDIDTERDQVLALFEDVFNHRSYTGRSGTFFGFEGLGCIYWHMVSKLLLATAETYFRAVREEADAATLGILVDQYYGIRAGIGLNKNPKLFGAFPTDPYSHTPANAGAKQPGMTGQVKEDILARWHELGVFVHEGRISFIPSLLRESEFLSETVPFEYFDFEGTRQQLEVHREELAFTYCQVPFVYRKGTETRMIVVTRDGDRIEKGGRQLSAEMSNEIFSRSGEIALIEVEFGPDH